MDFNPGGSMMKRAVQILAGVLALALIVVFAPGPIAQSVRNAVTPFMLQNLAWTVAGPWEFTGSLKPPRGTENPLTCETGEQFFNETENKSYQCSAPNTWTTKDNPPNPDTSNRAFTNVTVSDLLIASGNVRSVDYIYPGEQPWWLGAVPPNAPRWIDIPVASNQVTIRSLLFLVSDSDWTFTICESKSLGGCTFAVLKGSSVGWAGDYGYSEQPIAYVDRDGTGKLHIRAQGIDWFTFRALIHYTVN